jgi:hypothetical protein
VQLEEGLGRVPELKEFGPSKFAEMSTVLNEIVDKAWRIYSYAVEAAKHAPLPSLELYQVPQNVEGSQNNHYLPNV